MPRNVNELGKRSGGGLMTMAESVRHNSSVSSIEADEWVHIPTPGDHYSPKTGSAVITVIHQMNRWHLAAGGRARVLVAQGTWDGFDDCARQEIAFRRLGTPPKLAKLFDRFVGGMVGRRPLSGTPYNDVASALGRYFDGIVFIHNEPSGVEPLAKRCPNARVCLWVQNELFRTYTRQQVRHVVEHAHRLICCSNYIANGIKRIAGDNPKIVTLLNGVDTQQFRPANPPPRNDPPVILFLGRMVPEKGPDILLRAATELKRRGVPFHLRMVGSQNFNAADSLTSYEQELRQLSVELGESVKFRPFQPRGQVLREYQAADILCVPSNWDEPFGLVVLEGLACGLAVVASRRGGIPEAGGDSASGIVQYFDPPDFRMLAEKLANQLALAARGDKGSVSRRVNIDAGEIDWKSRYQTLSRLIAT